MKERSALIGGTVEIESTPAKGTTVYVRVGVAATNDKFSETAR
jgi:signal transduction histidine kinase